MRKERIERIKKKMTRVASIVLSVLMLACFIIPTAITPTEVMADSTLAAPSTSKTITEVPDENGEYTLSLGVTGAASSTSTTTSKTVDIVLVLDVSGSMGDALSDDDYEYTIISSSNMNRDGEYYVLVNDEYVQLSYHSGHGGGYGGTPSYWYYTYNGREVTVSTNTTIIYARTQVSNKLDALKTAVTNFINTAASSSGASNINISIVKFAGYKRNSIGDNTYYEDGYEYNYSQIVKGLTNVSTGSSSLLEALDELDYGGATSADYGMQHASTVLQNSTADSKYVIMFTDGEPNHDYNFDSDVADDTIEASKSLKDSGTTVYTVGVLSGANPDDTSTDINKYMNYVSSNYPNATSLSRGGTGSNQGYYQAATSADSLNSIFQNIITTITTTEVYTNVSITDTLSNYVELADNMSFDETGVATSGATLTITNTDGDPVSVEDAGNPSWSLVKNEDGTLTAKFGDDYTLIEGYTYTISFKVKATQAAYDKANEDGVSTVAKSGYTVDTTALPSNTECKVNYTVSKTTGSTTTSESGEDSIPTPSFYVPVSQLSLSKIWGDGADNHTTDSDKVTLTITRGTGVDATTSTVELGTSDWTDTVNVLAGPDGVSFKVEETAGPDYYDATYEYSSDDMNYETGSTIELIGWNSQVGYFKVTNNRQTAKVTIKKIVDGNFGDLSKTFSFTYQLNDGEQYTFSLGHNGTKILQDIPVGTQITITESDADKYTVTANLNNSATDTDISETKSYTFTVSDTTDDTVVITNSREVTPDTGTDIDSTPYIVMFSVAAIGAVAYIVMKKRKGYNS